MKTTPPPTKTSSVCHLVFRLPLPSNSCRVYLSRNNARPEGETSFSIFEVDHITNDAYCDDFGPMNFSSIVSFVEALDIHANKTMSDSIIYCAKMGPRALTNAAFLLGAYMLLTFDITPAAVAEQFAARHRSFPL